MTLTEDMPMVQVLAVLVAAVGAVNWGAMELLDTNLITDTLGLGAETAGLVYLVVAAAGVLVLVDLGQIVLEEGFQSTPLED